MAQTFYYVRLDEGEVCYVCIMEKTTLFVKLHITNLSGASICATSSSIGPSSSLHFSTASSFSSTSANIGPLQTRSNEQTQDSVYTAVVRVKCNLLLVTMIATSACNNQALNQLLNSLIPNTLLAEMQTPTDQSR